MEIFFFNNFEKIFGIRNFVGFDFPELWKLSGKPLQYSAIHRRAVQCSAVQCRAVVGIIE